MSAHNPAPAAPDPSGESDLKSTLREVRELMHDIRNHLNGILGLVSLLLLQSNDPTAVRVRPLFEDGAQQLMHLIDRLPMSVGGTPPSVGNAAVEPARFVPALLDLYRPFAAEHGVRLVEAVDGAHPCCTLTHARCTGC